MFSLVTNLPFDVGVGRTGGARGELGTHAAEHLDVTDPLQERRRLDPLHPATEIIFHVTQRSNRQPFTKSSKYGKLNNTLIFRITAMDDNLRQPIKSPT